MEYKKVEPSKIPTWDEKEVDSIEGQYVEKKTSVGANESNIYVLKTTDGKISVWGSTVIDSRMDEVSLGDDVQIVYKGMEKSEKTGRSYKNFEVYTKPHDDIPIINEEFDVEEGKL